MNVKLTVAATLLPVVVTAVCFAQETTFRIRVLAYQWTTTHQTLTFSWPGYANTSCTGNDSVNGYVSSTGNIYASGTSSNNCSTVYTPPSNQNIDIQKPVVFIVADTLSDRLVFTCTRNVRWSQCHALNPGDFIARIDKGHFEVQGITKGKEEWVKFDVVQKTAINRQVAESVPAKEAAASIDPPNRGTTNSNSGFPSRWKSLTSGSIRTLRFDGEYIYGETVFSEAATKAGVFALMDVRKNGDKYSGKTNARAVRSDGGASCAFTMPIELILVTPQRIEGRSLTPPLNATVDWSTCKYSASESWQEFTWIPVE